jgi:hypothetical protein
LSEGRGSRAGIGIMSIDWSRKRRERAAKYLALVEQTDDARVRAALLAMAQRWLESGDEPAEAAQQDTWNKSYHDFLMRKHIGRWLRAHYELPSELPHTILTLLKQLDQPESTRKDRH